METAKTTKRTRIFEKKAAAQPFGNLRWEIT